MKLLIKLLITNCLIFWMLIFPGHVRASEVACNDTLPQVFEKVSKSVVLITAIRLNPFSLSERISTSVGSGFIINSNGLILTNSHVVFGRPSVYVTLDDGESVPADLVGADPILDLAVLQIDAKGKKLSVLSLADSTLPRVGEEVIAVGNPLGLGQTLTRGVVSGVNRILPISPMSTMIPMIQTDAAINPGNSGGPLINRCGDAVGINTSVLMSAENIGFALPAVIIGGVLPELIEKGRVLRPWLGLRGQMIRKDELQQIFNIDLQDGFLVEMVEPGSPAEDADLLGGMLPVKIAGEDFLFGGDIITSANGRIIAEPGAYSDFLQGLTIGEKVELMVYRDGQYQTIFLTVLERPILPWDLPPEMCRTSIPY